MNLTRIVAALIAAALAAAPARAEEHTTFHHIDVLPGALRPCSTGMLVNLPPSWQVGDGAVVLMALGQPRDTGRDALVAALLHEHAAVVEARPVRCGDAPASPDDVIAGALDALDAVTRVMGGKMVVAIAHGPGAKRMLEVVRPQAAAQPDPQRARYAAAVALGDGQPAFALGAPMPSAEAAVPRLAALCEALSAVADGMGDTPARAAPTSAAEACLATMAGEIASASLAPR
jgi:hypothetical protein